MIAESASIFVLFSSRKIKQLVRRKKSVDNIFTLSANDKRSLILPVCDVMINNTHTHIDSERKNVNNQYENTATIRPFFLQAFLFIEKLEQIQLLNNEMQNKKE
jgi:hypothetical protein